MVIENKKGAELLSVIIWTVVIAAIAIIIGLFVYGFFEKGGGIVDTLPTALAAKAGICKQIASETVAFCEFTPIDLEGIKGDAYINCEYPGAAFKQEIDTIVGKPECPTNGEEQFCKDLRNNNPEFKGATINNYDCLKEALKNCADSEVGGEWIEGVACADGVVDYTDSALDKDDNTGKRCCISGTIAA